MDEIMIESNVDHLQCKPRDAINYMTKAAVMSHNIDVTIEW